MNRCLEEADVPEWMTKGMVPLIQTDSKKEPPQTIKKPIICVPMMLKILTVLIKKEIFNSLISCELYPENQKGCCKGARGTGELVYIDQHLKESKMRRKNPPMVWVDCKKSIRYGPTNMDNSLKLYKISIEVRKFIGKTLKDWRVQLIAEEKALLRGKSRKVSSREIRFLHYYLWQQWFHSIIYVGNAQVDTNLLNRRKRSIT